MRPNAEQDVWKHIRIGAADECWPWLAGFHSRGYGRFTCQGRSFNAHRLVYQLATGEDPGELFVCHHCDNPPCCNPAHLYLGTPADNVADMDARGRRANKKGMAHHSAKLTDDDVRTIRTRRAAGEQNIQLARAFGVHATTISQIVRGTHWRHV